MSAQSIPLPTSPVVDGRTWRLYAVEFSTADGEFSTHIYALSTEHAAAIVQELRQTARLGGAVQGWAGA